MESATSARAGKLNNGSTPEDHDLIQQAFTHTEELGLEVSWLRLHRGLLPSAMVAQERQRIRQMIFGDC